MQEESVDENEKIFFLKVVRRRARRRPKEGAKQKKARKRRDETLGLWKRDYILLLQKEKKK